MPRIYTVSFVGVAVSAAQDLIQITGATGKMIKILRLVLGCIDTSVATGQMLSLRGRFLPATVTIGSGGTTGITPSKRDIGDAACSSATCATNNTVKATTNGTAVIQYANGCHLFQGENFRFDNPPLVGPSEAWVFELLSTVSGTVNLSCLLELSEEGG